MAELIRKPRAKVERRLVEAALLRLVRYPGTTSVGTVMRLIDEYAASQHTERVHRHAERMLVEAMVEAHRAMDAGKKIFVCESPEVHEKIFYREDGKKFFKWTSPGDGPEVMIKVVGDLGTNLGTNHQTKGGTNRTQTVDVSTVPPVRDTSGKGSLATSATDTGDTATAVTDTSGGEATVTGASGKGAVATDVGDSSDAMDRGLTDDTSTVRMEMVAGATTADAEDDASTVGVRSERKVDNPGCGNGENDSHISGALEGLTVGDGSSKACSKCKRVLALSCYTGNRSRADGRASSCRDCESERKTGKPAAWRGGTEAQNVA